LNSKLGITLRVSVTSATILTQWRGNYFWTGWARPKAATRNTVVREKFRAGGARLKAPESGFIAKDGASPNLDCFMLKQQAFSKKNKKKRS